MTGRSMALLLVLVPVALNGDDVVVTALGVGATRTKALDDALRCAVVVAVASRLDAKTRELRPPTPTRIENAIVTAPWRYIVRFEVTRGAREDRPAHVSVEIKGTVSLDAVDREVDAWAGELGRRIERPRLMIDVEWADTDRALPRGSASTEMTVALKRMGFEVIDRQVFEANRARELAWSRAMGESGRVAALLADPGCEVVLKGRVTATEKRVTRVSGTVAEYAWTMDVRALRASSDRVVTTVVRHGWTAPLESRTESVDDVLARGLRTECASLGADVGRRIRVGWLGGPDVEPPAASARVELVLVESRESDGPTLLRWLAARPWITSAQVHGYEDGTTKIGVVHRLSHDTDVALRLGRGEDEGCPLGLEIVALDRACLTCRVTHR